MGVGKSTIGKRLAKMLSIPFYDLDTEIEKELKMDIPSIFSEKGESFFRMMEGKILENLCKKDQPCVISTGGGTPMGEANFNLMQVSGTTVWLDLPLKMIMDRVGQGGNRPLLADKNLEEQREFIQSHFAERLPLYQKADIRFDVSRFNSNRLKELAEIIHSR